MIASRHRSQYRRALGRDKTIEKVCSRFYWGKNMTEEIKHFCSSILSVVHRLHLSLEDGQEVAAIFYDLN